jgi:hypothetical protein
VGTWSLDELKLFEEGQSGRVHDGGEEFAAEGSHGLRHFGVVVCEEGGHFGLQQALRVALGAAPGRCEAKHEGKPAPSRAPQDGVFVSNYDAKDVFVCDVVVDFSVFEACKRSGRMSTETHGVVASFGVYAEANILEVGPSKLEGFRLGGAE